MEDYFKAKIDFKSATFYNDCVDKHNSVIKQFLDTDDKNVINILLNSLEVFAIKTNEAMLSFNELQEEDITQNIQPGYNYIFKLIMQKMSDLNASHIQDYLDRLIKIIHAFSSQPDSEFKFESISAIVYLIKKTGIAKKLEKGILHTLISSFKIKLDLKYYDIDDKADDNEFIMMKQKYNRSNDQICSIWRFCLENFFDIFNEEEFLKNIDIFQEYYE